NPEARGDIRSEDEDHELTVSGRVGVARQKRLTWREINSGISRRHSAVSFRTSLTAGLTGNLRMRSASNGTNSLCDNPGHRCNGVSHRAYSSSFGITGMWSCTSAMSAFACVVRI